MDKAIAKMIARLNELRREIGRIEAFLDVYREFGGETDAERPVMAPRPSEDSEAEGDARIVTTAPALSNLVIRTRRRATPEQIADAAIRTINDVGKPLSRVDLANALMERGMEIQSKDPANYIGTIMWRHGKDRLISLDGHGYWPVDRAYAPAGYEPGSVSAHYLKAASDNEGAAAEMDEEDPRDPDLIRDMQEEMEAERQAEFRREHH